MTPVYPAEREAQRRPAATANEPGSESVIDRYSQFNGLYCTEQDLRIEGSVEGEIQCDGTVTVAHEARVSAKVRARNVVIAGSASGDIECAERLTLRPTGEIRGEVTAASLVVEKGAFFEGEFHMADAATAPPTPPATRPAVAQPAPAPRPEPVLAAPPPEPAPAAVAEANGEPPEGEADGEGEIVAVHADAATVTDDANGAGDTESLAYTARPKKRRY